MKRRNGLLIALGVVVLGAVAIIVGLLLYLPGYIRQRVVAEAEARGIALEPGEISFGWQWLQLSGATVKLIGAPSFEAKVGLLDFQLADWKPTLIEASNVQAGVSGSLPRVLFELGEWTKNHPKNYELPIVASRVSIRVAEAAATAPWLELSGGFLTRTVAGAAFSAESCKLGGFELGKVGAGFTKTGSSVAIGFGDQRAQAAPLRMDASMDPSGAGKLSLVLTPTKLGLLSTGFGIPLPLPDVIASGNVELSFPPGLTGGEVKGKLSGSLKGFVPPHPPELDGFVFGDLTTLDTELSIDATRNRVTLANTKVKAGKFELVGGGSIVREGQVASVDISLKGALPCDALAGAAAQSRLGQLLGRASGKQGKRTALAVVRGDVSVEVGVQARSDDLLNAKLTRKIGIGCGLKPLTLQELLELTPNAKDLEAIGGEVGKKLEDIGKDLGLPPIPSGLPPLPPLPKLEIELGGPGLEPAKKKLAAPAPSG
ncbi:MAG TPA: hypothetical protein VEX18_16615 [Polyangiaceae bacterium]|nr:hypothetical protein [Polyangiaceae bacterium]